MTYEHKDSHQLAVGDAAVRYDPETGQVRSIARGKAVYTSSAVSAIFNVSPKTISRWAEEGRLSFTKTLGGHRRYTQAEVERLAALLGVTPPTQAATEDE